LPKRFQSYFRLRLCSFLFYLRKDERIRSLGERIDVGSIARARFKMPVLLYHLFRQYGLKHILERFGPLLKLPPIVRDDKTLRVALRRWPTLDTIDLQENLKCPSLYYKNGRWLPFCYQLIKESEGCL
jgi:hypothetical protein